MVVGSKGGLDQLELNHHTLSMPLKQNLDGLGTPEWVVAPRAGNLFHPSEFHRPAPAGALVHG